MNEIGKPYGVDDTVSTPVSPTIVAGICSVVAHNGDEDEDEYWGATIGTA